MADSGSFNADLGINMQFNIDGAGLVEMTKTIKEISKGKDLQRYWKDVEAATDSAAKAIERYNKNTQSKGLAENFLKQINALKAITNKENMTDIFPNMDINFDELIESAKKLAPKINAEFSSSNFSQAFKTFDLLKDKGIELGEVFSKLADYSSKVDENFKLRRENNEFRDLFGEQDIDKIKKDLSEIQKLRNEAEETFNNFLSINKVEKTDYWGDEQFSEYFNGIRNGSLTATEAIAKFKTEYRYLLEKSFKSNNDTFGLDQLQAFSTKLDSIFHQVEETSNKINDILSNGVIAKSVQNLSEDTTLSDSQRSIFGNILQDEESLKSITALFQKLIDETNQTKNTEIINTEQYTKIESLFTSIESSLSSIKGVLVDVGDGEDLSPLLSTINKINSSISELSSSVKNIGFNMNIDVGSDAELESKIQSKMSNALQAYQRLFEHIKMSNVGGSMVNTNFFEFDINQFDTMMAKIQAYRKFIENMRNQVKVEFGGKDLLYTETDKKYWTSAAAAMGQLTKAQNEMNKSADTNPLDELFGKTELTGIIEQLNFIVSKLDEISVAATKLSETFSQGLSVTTSVEEVLKLTEKVKELETELEKIKSVSTGSTETNISSGMKDAFSDSSTDTKPETEGMEQVEKATEEAVQAKKDFATANEVVQSSIDGSENPLKLEAELMEQIAKSAREAADAKKEFVEANKQVQDSADKSNNDLVGGHSENAEPSGVKKYKKKGYKAHDTGNHDNEKKVSNKAELGKALKDLQSEIIASIDESTSFVKEVTDFYDSQDNLVKTQMKVGDKNGSVRTYTTSYSMDKDGNATAWTSHIDSKKYQDQNKIIQEQIKNLQKLSAEKQKTAESERKSTVNQASKDQLEAWKQIQRIRKEITNTSNSKIIEQLNQEKQTYQEQYLAATKILKNNSDLYNSEQRLNELKKISLNTTKQIESSQQTQLNGYDQKLSSYNSKVGNYDATINKFDNGGWTSSEYWEKVQKAKDILLEYEKEVNNLKNNPELVSKESLANVENLGKEFENVTSEIKNMSASQKGYSLVSGQKELDKIRQILKENSAMSSDAKAKIKAYYKEIESRNPSMSLDKIHGEIMKIVNAEAEAGRAGKRMWDAIKEKAWYGVASTIGTYFGLNDVFRYIGQGISTIRELDTALTEMKKVSNETEQSLKNYQATTFDTADAVGTTAKQIQNSTADWMRLGESMDQAAKSAKDATILLNVSEFEGIDEATDALVSMSQAYKDLDKIDIIDVLNNVGNNYSISTDGLATALKDSASALVTANNDLNEAVALTTAGKLITCIYRNIYNRMNLIAGNALEPCTTI